MRLIITRTKVTLTTQTAEKCASTKRICHKESTVQLGRKYTVPHYRHGQKKSKTCLDTPPAVKNSTTERCLIIHPAPPNPRSHPPKISAFHSEIISYVTIPTLCTNHCS